MSLYQGIAKSQQLQKLSEKENILGIKYEMQNVK